MNRVKEFRKSKGLTQQHLATKLGIAVATVARWEAGRNDPSGLALDKLKQVGYKE